MLDVVACWRHEPTGDVPGRVRRAVTAQLRTWELRGIDEADVALVLTELVTNAVEHARTPLTVTVGLRSTTRDADNAGNADNGGDDGPVVRIEVADGSASLPRPQPLDRWAARGRGLQMIEVLTTGWGYTATATGKTVWAELTPDPALSLPTGAGHWAAARDWTSSCR